MSENEINELRNKYLDLIKKSEDSILEAKYDVEYYNQLVVELNK